MSAWGRNAGVRIHYGILLVQGVVLRFYMRLAFPVVQVKAHVVGVLAVEMFVDRVGGVLITEIAPRPELHGMDLPPPALWRGFGTSPAKPAIILPLTALVVTLLALSEAPEKRELYAMPLLVPLTLLAAAGTVTLRRGAANAWYWFSIMGFTFFILVGWVYWSGLELGVPTRLHAHLHRMQPGYDPGFKLLPFALGLAYTAAWLAIVVKLPRSPQRPAFVWAAGVTATWGVAATLFIGWVDTGKSYRSMIASMTTALPASYRCLSSRALGEPQRAMLHYFAGILTYREESASMRRDCDLMLVQGVPQAERAPGEDWIRIWEGNRPGDDEERYRLYRRVGAAVRQ